MFSHVFHRVTLNTAKEDALYEPAQRIST